MKKLLTLALLIGLAIPSYGVANCFAHVSTRLTTTSGTMDTTGAAAGTSPATILVAVVATYSGYNEVLLDSVGNRDWQTTQELDIGGTGSGPFQLILYKPNPINAANYSFSIQDIPFVFFESATVWACNGVSTDHPLEQQVGINTSGTGAGSMIFQPGAVTPQHTGDLVFTAGTVNAHTLTATIDSGYAGSTVIYDPGVVLPNVSAWQSAPSTAPINPTWTTNKQTWIGAQAVFRAAGFSPPGTPSNPYINTVIGTGNQGYGGDGGPAIDAFVWYPGELVKTSAGGIVFADVQNNRIRCYNPRTTSITCFNIVIAAGEIDTIAGDGNVGFVDNVTPLSAEFAHPVGMAITSTGCILIADQQNARVRKLCPGGNVTTIAGGGPGGIDVPGCNTAGFSDPGGGFAGDGAVATSALLRCPQSVAVDSADNIYIADDLNYRVRVVNTQGSPQTLLGVSICAGCINTVLGQGTGSCNVTGTATTSWVRIPNGLDIDASGNMYIAVLGCNAIYKVDTAGVSSLVAGSATFTAGYSGDGGLATAAQIRSPFQVKLTSTGGMYILDTGNSVIRYVDPTTGNISTIAGNYNLYPFYAPTTWNSGGYCCDLGPANQAGIGYPIGIYIDEINNRVYISDLLNSRVRVLYNPFSGTRITSGVRVTDGVRIH